MCRPEFRERSAFTLTGPIAHSTRVFSLPDGEPEMPHFGCLPGQRADGGGYFGYAPCAMASLAYVLTDVPRSGV